MKGCNYVLSGWITAINSSANYGPVSISVRFEIVISPSLTGLLTDFIGTLRIWACLAGIRKDRGQFALHRQSNLNMGVISHLRCRIEFASYGWYAIY